MNVATYLYKPHPLYWNQWTQFPVTSVQPRSLVVFLSCWRTFDRYSIPIQRQTSSHFHSVRMRLVSRYGQIGKGFFWARGNHGSPAFLYFFFIFCFCVERKCCLPARRGGGRKYPLLILVLVVSNTSMPPHKAPSVWGSPVRCVAEPLIAAQITSGGQNMERWDDFAIWRLSGFPCLHFLPHLFFQRPKYAHYFCCFLVYVISSSLTYFVRFGCELYTVPGRSPACFRTTNRLSVLAQTGLNASCNTVVAAYLPTCFKLGFTP